MDENCEPIEQKGEMVLRCRVRPQKSRRKGDFFVVLHGISLIIHENVAKIFTFFAFFDIWRLGLEPFCSKFYGEQEKVEG